VDIGENNLAATSTGKLLVYRWSPWTPPIPARRARSVGRAVSDESTVLLAPVVSWRTATAMPLGIWPRLPRFQRGKGRS